MTGSESEGLELLFRGVIARLDRLESKIDELQQYLYTRVGVQDCSDRHLRLNGRIGRLERWVYMGLGIALAVEVIVLPLIWVFVRR